MRVLTVDQTPTLAEEALCAFWAVVARRHPAARTGDLPYECAAALTCAAEYAIDAWVDLNVPPRSP